MWTKTLSSCLMAGALAAFGGPLDKAKIASDAKWIVHVDCEGLRNSAFGDYVMNEFVKPQLENNDQLKHANLSMNISNIMSLTAYGPAFDKGPEGVLIVTTTADPRKDLDTVTGMFLASAGTNAPFQMVEKDPVPLYTFGKAVYFAPVGHTLFVAKSREQILRAQEVLEGKAESLVKSSSFKDLREPPKSFFCAAVADGFIGTMGIPPQAQILREATGGRISLGEKDKNVFVNLVFQGKDDMATTRLQQVLQGLVALASLSQQDEEITRLAGSTKIAAEGGSVQVHLEYPVDKTIQKIKETSAEDHKPHGMSKASKGKDKAKHKKKKDVADDDAGAADDKAPAKDKDSPPKEKSEQPQ
jgi:hypothetical protein